MGGGGGGLLTNVINKNCTAGAHDIFQEEEKKTLLGTNRFQEIHCWGTCYISERKKIHCWARNRFPKYTSGKHNFIFNILLRHVIYENMYFQSKYDTIQ